MEYFFFFLSNACTAFRLSLFVTLLPAVSRLMLARGWEWTLPGQLTRVGQSYIPCYITSCSAIKTGVEEEEAGRACVFQGGGCSEICWASVCSWEMISDGPCKTSGVFFLFPSLICLYLDPWVLSLLLFLFSRLSCSWVSEWAAAWILAAGWGQATTALYILLDALCWKIFGNL